MIYVIHHAATSAWSAPDTQHARARENTPRTAANTRHALCTRPDSMPSAGEPPDGAAHLARRFQNQERWSSRIHIGDDGDGLGSRPAWAPRL